MLNSDAIIKMDDRKAKVEQMSVHNCACDCGQGVPNDKGDRLVEFCQGFIVRNTFFRLPKRKLFTWKSLTSRAGNIVRNQIDCHQKLI